MPVPKVDDEAIPIEEKHHSSMGDNSSDDAQHTEEPTRRASVAALLRSPLMGMSEQELIADVDTFVDARGLQMDPLYQFYDEVAQEERTNSHIAKA